MESTFPKNTHKCCSQASKRIKEELDLESKEKEGYQEAGICKF